MVLQQQEEEDLGTEQGGDLQYSNITHPNPTEYTLHSTPSTQHQHPAPAPDTLLRTFCSWRKFSSAFFFSPGATGNRELSLDFSKRPHGLYN